MKVLTVFGTRPEAIKMAPLVKALHRASEVESIVCVTGQHQEMLQQVLKLFAIEPEYHLSLMAPDQQLNGLASRMLGALDSVFQYVQPERVLVHGDTTTALVATLAAFHRKIPVGHVEAGLRSGNIAQPWPEEVNRRAVDIMSHQLFAPTEAARANLLAENLGGAIYVTGNTVIDALRIADMALRQDKDLRSEVDARLPPEQLGKKLLLVTGHRRENFGTGFANICTALQALASFGDTHIVYPVHLNPNVQKPVNTTLGDCRFIDLIAPLDYLGFVRMMQRADCILTDSGGIQEEAPYLGKPVLVMRDVTERPEAVSAKAVRLVGTDPARIVDGVRAVLGEHANWHMSATQLYGDGFAAERIVDALLGRATDHFVNHAVDSDKLLTA
ncbi:non-hydrolyzing UDP-N-acetylglucosamine 2-epimerase [Massilia litorea]|uniref:UDP-N-acetylglucosamine 2-epimerase (non-hydrolyzing) n=1 Tax=Massilia litorea TaxID=2769491 RepID=A0A7L9TZE3_9BURK|nr:UDP-N-acetylglucosamine 2-epimerase (non-hydrolyzing) [Massilia litorea]QOL48151.1 UDP-N-acetylglucosamine 2-epimerase (non-hydrolyzing) [Massilia litorea]